VSVWELKAKMHSSIIHSQNYTMEAQFDGNGDSVVPRGRQRAGPDDWVAQCNDPIFDPIN